MIGMIHPIISAVKKPSSAVSGTTVRVENKIFVHSGDRWMRYPNGVDRLAQDAREWGWFTSPLPAPVRTDRSGNPYVRLNIWHDTVQFHLVWRAKSTGWSINSIAVKVDGVWRTMHTLDEVRTMLCEGWDSCR